MKWYRILVPFCVFAILAVGCAAPHVSLDPIQAPLAATADSATFSVKQIGWSDPGSDGPEFLLELFIANTTGRAALLSPDSLEAVFRPDPIGKRPCAEILSKPVDFRKREERLVAAARLEHDPANPYDPDWLGTLYYGLSHSSKFDRKLFEYSQDKWKEAQWDKEHGGKVNDRDPSLLQWRERGLRDTVLWAHWEARRLFAIPAHMVEGVLTLRLRFGGVTDSVVLRQRLEGYGRNLTAPCAHR